MPARAESDVRRTLGAWSTTHDGHGVQAAPGPDDAPALIGCIGEMTGG